MKNRQTITIIENISKQHTSPAEQRAFEKAIAGLRYCEGLTYYIEENEFHDPLDIKEKIKEYINNLNMEVKSANHCIEINGEDAPDVNNMFLARIHTLTKCKEDLQNILNEVKKMKSIKAKLIVEVETTFDDDESSEETLRYCVEQDLEDAGFNVIDVSVLE